jgi:protease-4
MALVGSIGVIMQVPDLQGISSKVGISMRTIKSGEMKDIGNPFRDMTEEEKEFLQKSIGFSHEVFKSYVKRMRKIDNIDEISDGRFFDAPHAVDYKLVDELGTLREAMEWLKKKTGIDDAEWTETEESGGIVEKILSKALCSVAAGFKTELTSLIMR